ncbi:late promoter transcription protein [Synechococcus phage S-MbCM100]|nr:late promoter transcription protein [Synechococcus phage S-MbCM100]AHB81060.1 late promoter transcription protein [Synechococcus phage S-MbCM100]
MTIYNYSNPTLKNLLGENMPKEKLEDNFLTPTKFSQEIERLV